MVFKLDEYRFTSGAKVEFLNRAINLDWLSQESACLDIPHRNSLIGAPSQQSLPVWAERYGLYSSIKGKRFAERFTGVGVPKPYRFVNPASCHNCAIGADDRGVHPSCIVQNSAVDDIPESRRPIGTCRQGCVTVGAEGHAHHDSSMPQWFANWFSAFNTPKSCGVVMASGEDSLAVGTEHRGEHRCLMP